MPSPATLVALVVVDPMPIHVLLLILAFVVPVGDPCLGPLCSAIVVVFVEVKCLACLPLVVAAFDGSVESLCLCSVDVVPAYGRVR